MQPPQIIEEEAHAGDAGFLFAHGAAAFVAQDVAVFCKGAPMRVAAQPPPDGFRQCAADAAVAANGWWVRDYDTEGKHFSSARQALRSAIPFNFAAAGYTMPTMRGIFLATGIFLAGLSQAMGATQPEAGGAEFFEAKIRPVLVEHCYKCHSAESKKIKGDLRLDVRRAGPDKIIQPGKPNESLIIEAIRYANSDLQMPPKTRLPKEIIADFERWVQMGAPDPRAAESPQPVAQSTGGERHMDLEQGRKFWAFQPIRQDPPPEIAGDSWSQSPIDRFIFAKLSAAGITPAPPADKRTLIRRATFDLIGLPPSPEEVEAFVGDDAPAAFAKVIDRLLASPAYGERWGRHWLDVARYADCNGADESKPFPNAHHYRNYVIDAFNRDLPYDRFLTEQIAGDLLEPDETSAYEPLVGTGFLSLGTKIVAEKDTAKMGADIIDEQIDTFGRALLGLTLGCARCHDHKFDPIPTSDYYALAGIFQSTRTMAGAGSWLERPAHTRESLVALRSGQKELPAKRAGLKQLEAKIEAALKAANAIQLEAESFARGNVAVDREKYGKEIGIISDSGPKDNFAEYDITVETDGAYLLQLRYAAAQARPGRVLLDGKVVKERAISEVTGSWNPDGQRWFPEGKLALRKGVNILRIESKPMMSHIDKLRLVPLDSAPELAGWMEQVPILAREISAMEGRRKLPLQVMAVEEGKIKNVRVHIRGSHLSLGEEVPRRFLQVIAGEKQQPLPADQSGRLQLAKWLANPGHPLTSRVMVNRIWRWHFGRGIVATTDNFGVNGERPTHPELLDYLARRFMSGGWSIKKLHRAIMLSSTYQMSAAWRGAGAGARSPDAIDPDNLLRWRSDRQRLDAEAIRDALLMVSGRLDREVGNAPLKLSTYNLPTEDLEKHQKFYDTSPRRTIYLPVLRTNVYDFLTLFDFANPDLATGHRATTTVPTQALLMMNSPLVLDCSERIAAKLIADAKMDSDPARLKHVYLSLFGRLPAPGEEKLAFAFLEEYPKTIEKPGDPKKKQQAAWAALCQSLVISNDFVYVE